MLDTKQTFMSNFLLFCCVCKSTKPNEKEICVILRHETDDYILDALFFWTGIKKRGLDLGHSFLT